MKNKKFVFTKKAYVSLVIAWVSSLYSDSSEINYLTANNAKGKRESQAQSSKQKVNDPLMDMFNARSHSGFYLIQDFIYWRAQEDGLEYAVQGLLYDSLSKQSISGTGKAFLPEFGWDPGFKLGMGYVDPAYEWDLFLNWTWYHTKADGTATDGSTFGNDQLWPQVVIPRFGVSALSSAYAEWNLHYNTLDFSFARQFCIGKFFGMNPFGGLRAAWIHQKYDVQNQGFDIDSGSPNQEIYKNNLDFKGIGFRGGFSSSWYFSKHFSFFSDAAISLLYGRLVDHFKDIRSAALSHSENQTVANIEDTSHSMKSEVEIGVGFRYETVFYRDRFLFAFDVAWEYLNWLNMNQFFLPVTGNDPYPNKVTDYQISGQFERANGDLGMTGFRIGAKFAF